jgi:hypothetical protein
MTPFTAAGRFAPPVLLVTLVVCLGLTQACTNEGDTVIVNNGIDCGLIRNDLLGDWDVTIHGPDSTTLINCDDGGISDGTTVSVTGAVRTYPDVTVFAAPESTSFVVLGGGLVPVRPDELKANVEADSCLALVQVWNDAAGAWIQCIGEFDVGNYSIPFAVCDSADLDQDPYSDPDVACDMASSFTASVGVFF